MTFALLLLLIPSSTGLVREGDSAYVHLQYERAESLYTKSLDALPNDSEALWRLSRLMICMADVTPAAGKEAFYRKAEAFARQCIRENEQQPEGHTWLAAALGNIAMYEGGETKVRLAREIHAELSRAIALNPRDDVAYSILGSFYRALGGISWIERQLANLLLGGVPDGGYPEAETALKNAIAIAPGVIRHHYELGVLYREWGRDGEAKAELERATRLAVTVKSDSTRLVEMHEMIAELSH